MDNKKIINRHDLREVVKNLKKENKKVAATSGCFDILHAGHVKYLKKASQNCDCLIVFLNSDESVKQLKGDKRPIVSQDERMEVISALSCVDYVCLFSELTPCEIIEYIMPDVFFKGGDYRGKRIPEMEVLEKYGGSVEYLDFVDGCSTTNIIEKILSSYKEVNEVDSIKDARAYYQENIIKYKVKTVLIYKEAEFTSGKVEKQVADIIANINPDACSIHYVKKETLIRKIYKRYYKYRIVRGAAHALKAIIRKIKR